MRHGRPSPPLFLLALFALAGCSETVNPFVGLEEPYTLYGYLNPRVSRQTLRVIPIEQRIDTEPSAAIDAAVSSTHLESGEVTTWRSTFVQFDDSTFGNVFVANFRPAYGETYRVDVTRSDGSTSSAQVVVPVDIRIIPESNPTPTRLSYKLESVSLPNIVQAEMLYDTVRLQPLASGLNPTRFPITISYRGQEEAGDGGWRFLIEIVDDYAFIQNEFEAHCLTREWIGVRAMRFTVFVGDDAWVPPGGIFDPEVLAQPDLFSNVENGFGYVGAGYPVTFDAIQPAAVLGPVGFATTSPCDPARTPLTDPSCEVVPPPC
jgi:hypothetical protein